jgi:hypothetical protein
MYPNQQPPQNNQQGGYPPQPAAAPQQPGYGPQPEPTYAVDYLDQIAPPPPRGSFLSGGFGKIVIALAVIFIFAVGIIVALGNQKGTAPIEQMATKLENMERVVSATQINLKSGELRATNGRFDIWLKDTDRDAYDLLGRAGIKKTEMDKKMIASEKTIRDDLTSKFDDARLNAELDRKYAQEMAYQTKLIKASLDKIGKTGQAKAFRDFAKSASTKLDTLQKSFASFDDSKN